VPIPEAGSLMRNTNSAVDSRPGRRVRTRLTRLFALAVAGPLMAGSLAYAAGVEPVRRGVDEFLEGTAGFFRRAEASSKEFHLSPNPSGQGVLVMPLDDRGPRAARLNDRRKVSGNSKEKDSHSDGSKASSDPQKVQTKEQSTNGTSVQSNGSKTKADEGKQTSAGLDSHAGSNDGDGGGQSVDESEDGSDDDSDEGSAGGGSGSHSGSDGGDDDDSGSGDSDSDSDDD
jgi:hypothetical protein